MTILNVYRTGEPLGLEDVDNVAWQRADVANIDRYWSGDAAPATRHSWARLLWSTAFLYPRFDAVQQEPLVVSGEPDVSKKTLGLWDRDVCEVFIAPDRDESHQYFEFEAAPNGEWVDLAIAIKPGGRTADHQYDSGMRTLSRVEPDQVTIVMAIPWTAFGRVPDAGDTWLGNLFRCVGSAPTRGYLAWLPTCTAEPSFHVPDRFGSLHFSA